MYTKCYAEFAGKNQYKIHLWEEEGYSIIPWRNPAYVECAERDAHRPRIQLRATITASIIVEARVHS